MSFMTDRLRNIGVAALALLAAFPALGASPKDTEWPLYNNGYDGQRYSSLVEINAGNVKTLTQVCSLKIADAGAFQAGPLVDRWRDLRDGGDHHRGTRRDQLR